MFNKAKCPGSGLARFAAAIWDIVIDIGDNWKIIGYIDFTLTDQTMARQIANLTNWEK